MKDDKSPYVRIAELEKENRQLRELLKPNLRRVNLWNLTDSEHDILCALVAGYGHNRYVSITRLHRALYGHQVRCAEALRTHICHLRAKMQPHGVAIHCRSKQGYWLDAAGLKVLREAMQ